MNRTLVKILILSVEQIIDILKIFRSIDVIDRLDHFPIYIYIHIEL